MHVTSAIQSFTDGQRLLREAQAATSFVAEQPGLAGAETQALHASSRILLGLRLRREHPIVERLLGAIEQRGRGDAPPPPLDARETRALLGVLGSLSHAESDLLNHLRRVGLISDLAWAEHVVPHRERSNREQTSRLVQLKWGVASFFANVSPMLAGIGVAALIGGPLGQIGAAAVALGVGIGAAPRITDRVVQAGQRAVTLAGVNAAASPATHDEAALLVTRAAAGAPFLDRSRPILEQLHTELALARLLLDSRRLASERQSPTHAAFASAAGRYHQGLEQVLARHSPEDGDATLRGRLGAARAAALDPYWVESTARALVAERASVRRPPRTPEDGLRHSRADEAHARKSAVNAVELWLDEVLHALQGVGARARPRVVDVRPLPGGGFEVQGRFAAGWLRRDQGRWCVRVRDDGTIEPDAIDIEVGDRLGARLAEAAAQLHERLGGERRRFDVSRAGIIDWRSAAPPGAELASARGGAR